MPRYGLRLTAGALAPDGGSIFLDGTSGDSKPVRIYLDWSFAAQEFSATSLTVNDRPIAKRSPEEAEWVAEIASADSGGNETLASLRDTLLEKVRSATYAA
jgi:hypothetical protein